MMSAFETVVGIEIHAQLATQTKAWCSCALKTKDFENTHVCPICSAQPGTLPVRNQQAVDFALMAALATDCQINNISTFDRKNYFYPDLPKGYQITQFVRPVAEKGHVSITTSEGEEKRIRIQRIQMEEDAGKSTHSGSGSLINLNRAGTPLIEIVSEPDIRGPEEASQYAKKIHSILVYLGVCHGNLQEGNFRCDVNVSIRPKGSDKFGTRTEVKNLNSFKSIEKVVEIESKRHQVLIEKGDKVLQQTLLFDVNTLQTRVLRTKSDADDYRYYPEPDLIPLYVDNKRIDKLKETLPELPVQKKERFIKNYEITSYDADVLCSSKILANYFEDVCREYKGPGKKAANWILVEHLRLMNESGKELDRSPVSPKQMAELLNSVNNGVISGKMAKDVYLEMFDTSKSAKEIIEEKGMGQINDEAALMDIAQKVVDSNKTQLQQYLGGKDKLFGFFVGQLMKETKGQANPQLANKIMRQTLEKLK
jgi:aspartyl-tRNA(Asn)/glutamyl-tRNA(Gln) amidotransferase subunit B